MFLSTQIVVSSRLSVCVVMCVRCPCDNVRVCYLWTIRCLWPVLMSRSRSHDTELTLAGAQFMELLNIDWEHGTGVGVTRLL